LVLQVAPLRKEVRVRERALQRIADEADVGPRGRDAQAHEALGAARIEHRPGQSLEVEDVCVGEFGKPAGGVDADLERRFGPDLGEGGAVEGEAVADAESVTESPSPSPPRMGKPGTRPTSVLATASPRMLSSRPLTCGSLAIASTDASESSGP
jgi:hypothetical protein